MASQPEVVAYVPDLMDWSKLSGVLELKRVKSLDSSELVGAAKLIVDLDKADLGELEAVLSQDLVKIGYCSHVNSELRASAEALGFKVYARSRFFSDPHSFIC